MANRAVFVDRDGTMAKDVHYCSCPEDFVLFPETAEAIKLLNEHGFMVIVITNQSGIARGYFTEEMLAKIHEKMRKELAEQGALIEAIYYCPHHPDDNCECRKPKPKLVYQATKDFDIDLERSFVIGDLQMDIDLGRAVGCKAILISTISKNSSTLGKNSPDFTAPNLYEAVKWVITSATAEMI